MSHATLCNRRKRAEKTLVTAIQDGFLEDF
jgi:hypothetical protein